MASGTWTTPDGRFLVEELGEVRNPRTFLSNASNASAIPARLKDLFEPRIARRGGLESGSQHRMFPSWSCAERWILRQPIAKEFVRSLEALGTEWK